MAVEESTRTIGQAPLLI